VWSELVPEPVAVRYGWANWPTGNMVGRERLPLPTFRSDDWPIPEGVSYRDDAKKGAEQRLKELRDLAAAQAYDRELRQMQLDLPRLEAELHKGDVQAQLGSKLARIRTILSELQEPGWLSRGIQRESPDATRQIEAVREQVELLQALLAQQEEEREEG
jgi:hypothetical protein